MAVSLAACGNKGGGSADVDLENLSSDAELTVDIWDSNQLEGLRQIADEWSAETGVADSYLCMDCMASDFSVPRKNSRI